MKILIIAMSDSVHTARWLSQITDQGWEIHLFPCINHGIVHPEISNVTIHHFFYTKKSNETKSSQNIKNKGIYFPFNPLELTSNFILVVNAFINKYLPDYQVRRLRRLIKKIKPDIIHSLEFQHSSYLTLQSLYGTYKPLNFRNALAFLIRKLKKKQSNSAYKKIDVSSFQLSEARIAGKASKWIATNWGSDIYLFGRLSDHKQRIQQVLQNCDYYSCECNRDVALAKEYGLRGKTLPVFPNTGGFDLARIKKLRQPGLSSDRKVIMLKGYQGWAYRALTGLRALERCADILMGYTIAIYLGFTEEVKIAAELFEHSTGIPVKMMPYTSHDEILRHHGQARISIGLSISDAISTSFLEALVMGSFPIQSWTACADEWIEDGKTGMLVPPEDPDVIEQAIRRALIDGDMVNKAAEKNWEIVSERLDHKKLKPMAVNIYKEVYHSKKDSILSLKENRCLL